MTFVLTAPWTRRPTASAALRQAVEGSRFGVAAGIADGYYAMYEQSPLAWSNEIDIRPFQGMDDLNTPGEDRRARGAAADLRRSCTDNMT
jgi:hypothetical protein